MNMHHMKFTPSMPETRRKMYAHKTVTLALESLRGVIIQTIQGAGIVNAAQKVCSGAERLMLMSQKSYCLFH